MESTRKFDVMIAGAGPAGLATALYIVKRRPALAGRIVAIERSAHPRFKVCAGGLIPKTMLALGELGIPLDVPAVEVIRGAAATPVGNVDLSRGGDMLATVIRRDRFDAMLARAATDAGVEIVQRSRVLDVTQDAKGVRVSTDGSIFDAQIVVGARKESIGRALMTDIAVDPERTPEFTSKRYRFDFRCVSRGISGYSWSFPCLIGGAPHLNVGTYDQRAHEFTEN